MSVVKTKIRVNKLIYRLGFQARPLLIIMSAMLILGTTLVGVFGYIGAAATTLMVYGFLRLSKFMKNEIEKGNLRPIDDYFSNLNKPDSIYNDNVIEILKEERSGEVK